MHAYTIYRKSTIIIILQQKQPIKKITIVHLTEEMKNISPVLASVVMQAGYEAIDILCDKVGHVQYI